MHEDPIASAETPLREAGGPTPHARASISSALQERPSKGATNAPVLLESNI